MIFIDMVILIFLGMAAGLFFGFLGKQILLKSKKNSLENQIREKESDAENKAHKILEKAHFEAKQIKAKAENLFDEKKEDFSSERERLLKKEDFLDKRQIQVEDIRKNLEKSKEFLVQEKNSLEKQKNNLKEELSTLSGISKTEAEQKLLEKIEKDSEEDLFFQLSRLKSRNLEKINKKAKEILSLAVQKIANPVSVDLLATPVKIENKEIKGKIIGREGRNIKSFEKETGAQIVIDESPNSVLVSCFDPIRREVAARTLQYLIEDGRIQPAKIEEFSDKSKKEVFDIIKQKGREAAEQCGFFNIPDDLLAILGRLHFRTSYGQNILNHSVEMAHISGVLAEELDADKNIAKMGALFHDIGKAVDHEVEGTHVEIGRRILQKFNIDEEVVKAMQAHHEEYPYENVESLIVQTADSISGGRPGARSDTANMYVKKLEGLERITSEFKGVMNSYALSAGREVRVFVKPDEVSDFEASKMAREIALKVENELKYPGEIKVAVIREKKIIEFAR